MKWVYLPTMLALAFGYTKISLNDFIPKSQALVSNRMPASTEIEVSRNSKTKLPLNIFYRSLKVDNLAMFDRVSSYKGIVAVNPYVENFGFVIDDNKQVHFMLLNSTEASKGTLFHDVLAHLVSAKILDKTVSWFDYFEAYKKGLAGEYRAYSFYTDQGISSAIFNSEKVIEDNMTKDFPFEFTLLQKNSAHVETAEKNIVESALKKSFPKIQFFDLYGTDTKKSKYQALVRIRPQDKIQWIILREVTNGDYDRIFNPGDVLPTSKRLELINANIYSHKLDKSLQGVTIDKKFFALKFAEQFSARIDFDQVPQDDDKDIVLDEAYVLGSIHRNSLGKQSDDYIKAWATIPAAMIDEKAVELKYKMKDFIAVEFKEKSE